MSRTEAFSYCTPFNFVYAVQGKLSTDAEMWTCVICIVGDHYVGRYIGTYLIRRLSGSPKLGPGSGVPQHAGGTVTVNGERRGWCQPVVLG